MRDCRHTSEIRAQRIASAAPGVSGFVIPCLLRKPQMEGMNDGMTGTQREELLKRIAEAGKTSFFHLLLYNSIRKTSNTRDAIDSLIVIHSNLMAMNGLMAGFQFVAIFCNINHDDDPPPRLLVASLSLLAFGSMLTMVGAIISLVTIEYLKGISDENIVMQVEGILKNWCYFRFSDICAVLGAMTIAAAVNTVVHSVLPELVCYMFNIFTLLIFAAVFVLWVSAIVVFQSYGGGRHIHHAISDLTEKDS